MRGLLLAPLLLLGAVPAQEEPSLDWLLGNWQVSYRDAALGDVTGYVIVERDRAGTKQTDLFMRYVAEHPLTLERHELTGIGVRQKRGVVEAAFFGPVPAAKADAATGPPTLTALPGQVVRATLEGSEAKAVAGPAGPVHTRVVVRFEFDPTKPPAERMEGTWRQKPSPLSAPGAVRGGVLKDGLLGGAEVWTRAAISIDSVSIAEMDLFGVFRNQAGKHPPERPLQDIWLRVSGSGLPVEPGQKVAVAFQDPRLRFVDAHRVDPEKDAKGRPQLQIRVEIQAGIQPGPKALTVNGAAGLWEFDFPGLQPKAIRYVRRVSEDRSEAVAELHTGELFTIEVEYPNEPFYTDRKFATIGGREPLSFTVVKDPRRPRVFHAGPFLLVDPFAGGTMLRDHLPPRAAGVVIARPGDVLKTFAVDVTPPGVDKPLGACRVSDDPEALWETALVAARDCRLRHPERYEIKDYIKLEFKSVRTILSAEDHAALILMVDEICALLWAILEEASTPVSAKDLRNFARYLVREHREKRADEHPLLGYAVPGLDGSAEWKGDWLLKTFMDADFEAKNFKDRPDAYIDFVVRGISYAQGKMAGEAAEGLRYYRALNRWDPRDLLKSVGRGFGRVAAALIPRLLRPRNESEPLYPRWLPDQAARGAIATIETVSAAVAAQHAYAGLSDTILVLIETAGLAILALPGIGLGYGCIVALELMSVAEITRDMLQWQAASRRARAARGTASFAGEDPEDIARGEADDALFSAVVGAISEVGPALFLHVVAAGAKPSAKSMRLTLDRASVSGASNLRGLEKDVFEYLVGRARHRLANGGVDALDAVDRQVLDLAFPGGAGRPPPPAVPAGKVVDEVEAPSRFESPDPVTVADPFAGLHHSIARQAEAGSVAALDRLDLLTRVERTVDAMPAARKGRVHEALEILRRLGNLDPAVKRLDPVEALRMMAFHSVDAGLSPAELVARVSAWNKIAVDPGSLARAANGSIFEGEITAARALQWADRFNGKPGPPRPVRTDTPSKVFVRRHKEIADLLEKIGGFDSPRLSATVSADRGLDPLTAAVGLSLTKQPPVPPARLREILGLTDDQLKSHLDEFLKKGQLIEDEAVRADRLRRAFEDQTAPAPPPPPPDAPTSPTLRGERAPRSRVEAEVKGHLREIGLSPDQIEKLDIARALEKEGLGAAEIVVATGYFYEIPASRISALLGIDRVEMAGILDRVVARRFRGTGAYVRAEKVAEYMGMDGLGAVIESRTREFLRKMRRVTGVEQTQIPLGARWDPDSAVVGMCFEKDIAPDVVRRGMGMDDAALRGHLDRYLLDHHHVGKPGERAALIDDYLAGRKPPPLPESAPPPKSVPRRIPQLEPGELAAELQRMGVDGPESLRAARELGPVAERDARIALAAGAWNANLAPAQWQRALGLSREQTLGLMDRMLADRYPALGMKERAEAIANYVNKADGSKLTRAEVLDLLNHPGARLPATPHRPPVIDAPVGPPVDPHARTAIEPVDATTKIEAAPLDRLYGSAQRPRGERVKPWERAPNGGSVLANPALAEVLPGAAPRLSRTRKYLWLVDRDGKLMMGVEAPILGGEAGMKYGHPSLNGGGEARIAGELEFDPPSGRWVVNNKSGRYSLHADRGPEQLKNVAARFAEAGVGPVGMNYLQPPPWALPK